MTTVHIMTNRLRPAEYSTHQVEDAPIFLFEHFQGRWPPTAKVYRDQVDVQTELPLACQQDIGKLRDHQVLWVVVYPQGVVPLLIVGGLVLAGAIAAVLLIPEVPKIQVPSARGKRGSPNNRLGERSNVARPEERIPDIFGVQKSIPDLITVPYTTYEDHRERETAVYCVGVGTHLIQKLKDGDTFISQIQDASAKVYGPGDAPLGSPKPTPQVDIGPDIDDELMNVYEVSAVNGQVVEPFNARTFYGTVRAPNQDGQGIPPDFFGTLMTDNGDGTGTILLRYAEDPEEITDRVFVGDTLFISWPTEFLPTGSGPKPDLQTPAAGVPTVVTGPVVTSITDIGSNAVELEVDIPVGQQSEWSAINAYTGGSDSVFLPHMQITPVPHLYVGPFFIDFEHPLGSQDFAILLNFVAPQGLFVDDGVTAAPLTVALEIILTEADANGTPIGTPEVFNAELVGSAVQRSQRAVTVRCVPSGFVGTRALVQVRRFTNSPRREEQLQVVEADVYGSTGTDDQIWYTGRVVDEVRWTHCYSVSVPPNLSFGDVTLIHTRTFATQGALRLKRRELNCQAARMIQTWNGSTFGGSLVVAPASENVLFHMMKDPNIGNLGDAQIDFLGIAAAFQAVRDKFNDPTGLPTSFSHTFDSTEISSEETFQAVCMAAFCLAYREGDVIKAIAELATDDSALVLGHRNIFPKSQRVTHTFGEPTEHDSVEVHYFDPSDDSVTKAVLPDDPAPRLRTRRINVIGLRTERQAYWHAWRAFQRMQYQRQVMDLKATQEAGQLISRQKVLAADRSRQSVQDGHLEAASGAVVFCSQVVELAGGAAYTMFLLASDGSVEAIAVSAADGRRVTLASVPSVAPVVDPAEGVPTIYVVVDDEDPMPQGYLVQRRVPVNHMLQRLELVNYSHLYYVADGLRLWVTFDTAPQLLDISAHRSALAATGLVVSGGARTSGDFEKDPVENVPSSYTVLAWITPSAHGVDGSIYSSSNDVSVRFVFGLDEFLKAGHGGTFPVSDDWTSLLGERHLAAVTYDADSGRMALFRDGALVDEASVAGHGNTGEAQYLAGFVGSCDMLLEHARPFSDREVREFYLKTR